MEFIVVIHETLFTFGVIEAFEGADCRLLTCSYASHGSYTILTIYNTALGDDPHNKLYIYITVKLHYFVVLLFLHCMPHVVSIVSWPEVVKGIPDQGLDCFAN